MSKPMINVLFTTAEDGMESVVTTRLEVPGSPNVPTRIFDLVCGNAGAPVAEVVSQIAEARQLAGDLGLAVSVDSEILDLLGECACEAKLSPDMASGCDCCDGDKYLGEKATCLRCAHPPSAHTRTNEVSG